MQKRHGFFVLTNDSSLSLSLSYIIASNGEMIVISSSSTLVEIGNFGNERLPRKLDSLPDARKKERESVVYIHVYNVYKRSNVNIYRSVDIHAWRERYKRRRDTCTTVPSVTCSFRTFDKRMEQRKYLFVGHDILANLFFSFSFSLFFF